MILICSCQDATTALINHSQEELEHLVLIDTFNNQLQLDTAYSITEAEFHPMYMGKKQDSITLNYWPGDIEYTSRYWEEYKSPDSNDLKIFVDSTQIIGSVNNFYIPPPPSFEEENQKWKRKFVRGKIKSYPIIIKNNSVDTLKVGYGDYIPMIIEAKDSLGNWKPIQKPYIYFCGTGLSMYFLPPEEIIITSCKLFEGEYKTKMRIVFGFERTIQSNEFIGKINYEQFNKLAKEYY